jgi:oxygen-dependent protoporphyrinogen oxidase
MSVVIIGGGITGLAAAYELTQRRVPFTLLEASPRLGGLIATEKADGFTIEAGPDSLLAQKAAGMKLCEELGLAPRLLSTTPPRRAFVLENGRLHPLPSPSVLGIPATWTGIAAYDLLPLSARARLAMEPLIRRRPPEAAVDESVASFFRRRFGDATVRLIAEPLLGGIHAGDIEQLSMRALFPRLIEAEGRGSVLRSLRRTRQAAVDGVFRSPAGGMGEIVSAIARRLDSKVVHLGTAVSALRRTGDGWMVDSTSGQHAAHAVILAVPAYAAARLLESVDADAARLCAEVPYVSTTSVALAWPRTEIAHELAGSGFVVARSATAPRIAACTWVSSKWPGRAPAGWALVRVFIGGARDPDAVSRSDDDLVTIAVTDISPVLGVHTAPQLTRVHRWRDAGAQHNVGHLDRVRRIEGRLAACAGIITAGSGFRSVGIPDCIADGRAAATAAAAHITELLR